MKKNLIYGTLGVLTIIAGVTAYTNLDQSRKYEGQTVVVHSSLIQVSKEDLVKESDAVIAATVVAVEPKWRKDPSLAESLGPIYSVVTVSVDEVVTDKAGDLSKTVTFSVPGGTIGDTRVLVSDEPQFTIGQRNVLFLKRFSDGSVSLAMPAQGRYVLTEAGVVEDERQLDIMRSVFGREMSYEDLKSELKK